MVGEAVEEGSGQPLGPKDLGPLVEGQVGGHENRSSLVAAGKPFVKIKPSGVTTNVTKESTDHTGGPPYPGIQPQKN